MLKIIKDRYYNFTGNIQNMFQRSLIALYLISLIFVSCRSTKPLATTAASSGTAKEYIDTYSDLAVSEMRRTGVPASITLAQGMLESGYGKSSLATEANNHFGVKCHDNWDGPTVRHTDDRRNECFRKYRNPAESFRDHSDFLRNTPRYSFLFDLDIADYKGWARGLKKAGYATNPNYSDMLIEKIEQYGLDIYDNPSAKTSKITASPSPEIKEDSSRKNDNGIIIPESPGSISPRARVQENNRIQFVIVNEKDTKSSIEKELNLLGWELQRYNELDPGFTLSPGQMLYLQPKRDKAEPGKEIHIAKEGETMYLISQKYGIKLKQLYLMNRMEQGREPAVGQKIWLRSTKPVD